MIDQCIQMAQSGLIAQSGLMVQSGLIAQSGLMVQSGLIVVMGDLVVCSASCHFCHPSSHSDFLTLAQHTEISNKKIYIQKYI